MDVTLDVFLHTVPLILPFVVQLLSHVRLFATPWTAAHQASLSFTISQSLLKLMSIESVMPSNHLILCHPLFLLPSIFLSIRVFSNESGLCIWWSKYGSFSFSISPSSEYSSLISFRIDWLHLLFCPRVSQESSSIPYFESISSMVLSLLFPLVYPLLNIFRNCAFLNIFLELRSFLPGGGPQTSVVPILNCQAF